MSPRKGETLEQFKARRDEADARRRATPEAKQRAREVAAEWRERNRERKAATDAAWREREPERMKKIRARWKAANKDRITVHKQTRRARAAACGGVLSADIVSRLMRLQRAKCANCAASLNTGKHLDHITPLARGGRNEDANVQLLCPLCNCRKNAHDPVEWAQSQGRLL